MLRIRVAGTLIAAMVLMAASCGDGGDAAQQQPEAEAPVTTAAALDESVEAGDAVTTSTAAAAEPDGPDEAALAADGADAAPVDASTLLASATTQLDGRSVRGEASFDLAPGFGLSTSFESDADGDLAAMIELPPGFDPEFPGGADAEFRYVDGVMYVRPPVLDETLAELGVDEAWYVAEPTTADDPMAATVLGGAGGVLCVFPQAIDEPLEGCDPLGETGAFLEAAGEAEVVGREDVRGVEATRVRFLVSLLDLAGDALGFEPGDGEASDDGSFDDTASDPFAEGVEQILGFLDAGFEVEVWIDDQSLVRRLSFDLASLFAGIAGPEAAAEIPSNLVTLEFYDFDADISVDAPPPDAIVDEDLLAGGDDYATSEEYEPYDDDYS